MRVTYPIRYRLLLILAALSALLSSSPVFAQASGQVRLSPPEIQQFPVITAGMDVRDPAGKFVAGLHKDQVTLVENGQPVAVDDLKETSTPLEISVAIDPSPSMAVPAPDGRSRFEMIADSLEEWAGQQSGGQPDRYNLFVNNSSPAAGLTYRSDWLQDFQGLKVDLQNAKPSLDSLTQALQQTAAEAPGSSSGAFTQAILWVTPPPEGQLASALPTLVDQAQKAGVHLFIWSVSTAVAFHSAGAQALEQAAQKTGGQFFPFSGAEPLPKPDDWFNPLRGGYTLRYTTHAHAGGAQTLAARVQLTDGPLESAPLTFQLDLQPPNPVLLSPPARIQRTCPVDCPNPSLQLHPSTTALRILVEFPDKHPRALSAIRLYVDGKLAAERTSEPFNQLQWNLGELTASGLHRVSVEAVDQLGMSKRSAESPIQVEVNIARTPAWRKFVTQPGVLAGAGAATACLLLWAGYSASRRFLPAWKRRWAGWRRGRRPTSGAPVGASGASQALEVKEEAGKQRSWLHPGRKPAAQLARVEPGGEPLVLAGPETTLGQEAARAEIVLDDPSVDPLHAQIVRQQDGSFWIFDHGSAAGTWVNYEPVPSEGTPLQQHDLIHLGRLSFRFELLSASPPREVIVEKLDPDS